MTITIHDLSEQTLERLLNDCGDRIFYNSPSEHDNLFDVIVNSSAIVKTCIDMVVVDLGGRKSYLVETDFSTITVR